jgi:hypothetical protein
MTNAVVTIDGTAAALPTLLGQAPPRIPTSGKIRAGIKVLTKKAAEYPRANEIYERGRRGEPFIRRDRAGDQRGGSGTQYAAGAEERAVVYGAPG